MQALLDLFHRIYDVQAIVRLGGMVALVAVIFAETGLLVGFFLPGDSLLVTAGVFCTSATPGEPPLLNIVWLNLLVMAAAIAGDTVGYWIGAKSGPRLFTREQSLFFSKKHLLRTKAFYERHGGKTIILARFVPIVRTYAPFVAGVGAMPYGRYIAFCIAGALLWVGSLCAAGYFFGNIPAVRNNLTAVILLIVFVSILPGIVAWAKAKSVQRHR